MKINSLKVNAYGNIENKNINFQDGVNIIYGKNESGKSTMLNYIISSFYGISKNKDGRLLSDYEKYKPWNSSEFSGRIEYELDNGERFEVFRDFNKKNPKIYNDKLEDITSQFEVDKKDGSKFFFEQTGVDKQTYLSTVVSMQEEVRLNEKDQNILVQKIANLAGTGEDNVSYKKALTKLQEKLRDEIGNNKTTQKPINILEKEIKDIEYRINEITPYKNRKYEIDEEKEELEEKIKELELEKKILVELQETIKDEDLQNKEIEIKEKSKKDNLAKIIELKNEEKSLQDSEEQLKTRIENAKAEIMKQQEEQTEIELKISEITQENIEKKIEEEFNIKTKKEKNKSSIFLFMAVVFILIGIILTIVFKKYAITGTLAVLTLIGMFVYLRRINRQKKSDIENENKRKETNILKIAELQENKNKILELIKEIESELKKTEQEKQEIDSKIAMIKGQTILLEKNNEQINNELGEIQKTAENLYNKNKDILINKYKEDFKAINDLIEQGNYKEQKNNIEEKINDFRIKLNRLEIEHNTIAHQLDEMVILKEKLEANNEKFEELKKKEKIINIAIENLTVAYEEMKNTITPKFTRNLSSSISKISNSKYEKVTINDENGMLVENNRGEYIEASKLSTGTIDQLYLALRLSMVNELSDEKLPIILDESFAYFDNKRLENILKYLKNELSIHQIIIFTCTKREQEILDSIGLNYNLVEL